MSNKTKTSYISASIDIKENDGIIDEKGNLTSGTNFKHAEIEVKENEKYTLNGYIFDKDHPLLIGFDESDSIILKDYASKKDYPCEVAEHTLTIPNHVVKISINYNAELGKIHVCKLTENVVKPVDKEKERLSKYTSLAYEDEPNYYTRGNLVTIDDYVNRSRNYDISDIDQVHIELVEKKDYDVYCFLDEDDKVIKFNTSKEDGTEEKPTKFDIDVPLNAKKLYVSSENIIKVASYTAQSNSLDELKDDIYDAIPFDTNLIRMNYAKFNQCYQCDRNNVLQLLNSNGMFTFLIPVESDRIIYINKLFHRCGFVSLNEKDYTYKLIPTSETSNENAYDGKLREHVYLNTPSKSCYFFFTENYKIASIYEIMICYVEHRYNVPEFKPFSLSKFYNITDGNFVKFHNKENGLISVRRDQIKIDPGIMKIGNTITEVKGQTLNFDGGNNSLIFIYFNLENHEFEIDTRQWELQAFNTNKRVFVGYKWGLHVNVFGESYEILPDIAFIGDETVSGMQSNYSYVQYISNELHTNCLNYGKNGIGISGVIPILSSIPISIKNYVIQAGANDYASGTSLEDFEKNIQSMINMLYTKDVHACFLTPIRRVGGENENSVGKKLSEYVDKLLELCNLNGISCKDIYNYSGLNPDNPYNKEKYFLDNINLNKTGHTLIGKICIEYVKENTWD